MRGSESIYKTYLIAGQWAIFYSPRNEHLHANDSFAEKKKKSVHLVFAYGKINLSLSSAKIAAIPR